MVEKLNFLNEILCSSLRKSIKSVIATRMFHRKQNQTNVVIPLVSKTP